MRKASRRRIFLSLIISSALTVSPMNIATMTDMKIYTGRLLFCSRVYDGLADALIKVPDDKCKEQSQYRSLKECNDKVLTVRELGQNVTGDKHRELFQLARGLERYLRDTVARSREEQDDSSFRDL
ncbi:MAG: hypothetical protein MZV63_01095 [Marinilabiliales bacterium]|nr:hypothetical protein [Marinilabiliales bacterium]